MRVRLLKHWNGFSPNRIFAEMGDGAANVLIDRGFAEQVESGTDEPTGAEPKKAGNSRATAGKRAARKRK